MRSRPEWFAPKQFGYGAGLPISWQGWLILGLFLAVTIGASVRFADRPKLMAVVLAAAVGLFVAIAALTTRGGWHWRC